MDIFLKASDNNNHKVFQPYNSFNLPLTEESVLMLQKTFVTCGIQIIKIDTVYQGRIIIKTILDSLKFFDNIGCITFVPDLPVSVCNIINHIRLEKYDQVNLCIDLEDFLTIHPCFDFIWIEYTEQLQKKYTLHDLKKLFEMYHVQERMPVIIVQYE